MASYLFSDRVHVGLVPPTDKTKLWAYAYGQPRNFSDGFFVLQELQPNVFTAIKEHCIALGLDVTGECLTYWEINNGLIMRQYNEETGEWEPCSDEVVDNNSYTFVLNQSPLGQAILS